MVLPQNLSWFMLVYLVWNQITSESMLRLPFCNTRNKVQSDVLGRKRELFNAFQGVSNI